MSMALRVFAAVAAAATDIIVVALNVFSLFLADFFSFRFSSSCFCKNEKISHSTYNDEEESEKKRQWNNCE